MDERIFCFDVRTDKRRGSIKTYRKAEAHHMCDNLRHLSSKSSFFNPLFKRALNYRLSAGRNIYVLHDF